MRGYVTHTEPRPQMDPYKLRDPSRFEGLEKLLRRLRELKDYKIEYPNSGLLAHDSGAHVLGIEAYIIKADESTTTAEEVRKLIEKEGDFLNTYPRG